MIAVDSLALLAGRTPRIPERDCLTISRAFDCLDQPVVDLREPIAGEIVCGGVAIPILFAPGELEREISIAHALRGWGKTASNWPWHTRRRLRDLPPWKRARA